MIGALLTKRVMEKHHVAMQEAMDPVALMTRWSDDVTLTPMGCEPIRGKEAVLAFERAYVETLDSLQVTLRSVSLARPWAFGFTNTVVLEDEIRVQRKDGRTQTLHEAIILELERGRIAAVRVFLADPDYEKVVLGVE